jgi:hypothetical protein
VDFRARFLHGELSVMARQSVPPYCICSIDLTMPVFCSWDGVPLALSKRKGTQR